MSMNREQGLFLGVLVLSGTMIYMWFDDAYVKQPLPRPREIKVPVAAAVADVAFPAASEPRYDGKQRDFFAQPKDWNELPPLTLDPPPLPEIGSAGPLLVPAPAPAFQSLFRLPPRLNVTKVDAAAGDGAVAEDETPSETATPDKATADAAADASRLKRFDWIVMKGERRAWGRVLTPDKLKLLDDDAMPIEFETIEQKTGKVFARGSIKRELLAGPFGQGFGFADTAVNRAQLREYRAVKDKSSAAQYLAAARECLAWREEDPKAVLAIVDRIIEKSIAIDPGAVEAWELKAQVRELAHDTEGEFAVLDAAKAAGVADPRLKARHARLLRKLGLLSSAEQLLEEATKENLLDASSLRELGQIRLARGDSKGALEAYDKAQRAGNVTPEMRQQLRVDAATAALFQGDVQTAYTQADQAVKATPAIAAAPVARGTAQWLLGKRDQAMGDYKAALDIDPRHRDAVFDAGLAAGIAGDLVTAEARLTEANELDPLRGFEVECSRGIFAELTGDLESAAEHFKAALELHPDHPFGLYRYGRLMRRTENLDGAAAQLSRALLEIGEMSDVLNELGYVALLSDNYEDAVEYLSESLRREPKQTAVRVLLATALARLNRIPEARAEYETAASGTDDATALAGIAFCAYREGDADLAVERFAAAKAAAGDPNTEIAKYSGSNQDRIDIHRSKTQWVDVFDREQIKNDWTVLESFGPTVGIERGVVTLSGSQRPGNADERTELRRDADGKTFVLFEAEMKSAATNAAVYGARLSLDKLKGNAGSGAKDEVAFAEIAVALFPADRTIRLHVIEEAYDKVLHDWVVVHTLAPEDKLSDSHRFTIECVNHDVGKYVVRFDDKTLFVNGKGDFIVNGLKKVRTAVRVSAFALAKARENVAVEIDSARVVRFGTN